jgi:inorganic pyrophosphatase
MEDLTQLIGQKISIEIDRPLGSKHPTWGFIHTLNYGYVPGLLAPDGTDRDVYLLGVFEPVDTYTGICIAIVHRHDDDDDKLVIVPEGVNYTDDQISALTEFIERYFDSEIIRK